MAAEGVALGGRVVPTAGSGGGGATDRDLGDLLRVEEVVAGYGGGDVLKGTTFSVPEHSITCIVGPNGAGKSTVSATISGVLPIRLGRIVFDGEVVSGRKPREVLQRGIVQVPQNHSLFRKMTVRENVEFGAFLVRDRRVVRQRYERVAELFPIVAERADAKAGSLSGGQQRLVEFARCMMLDPRLAILDEPSLGLDPQVARTVFRTIRRMHEAGVTILLVEQNARAALRLSTHGVVLESGRVRLTGSGREILEHPEIGRLYLGGGTEEGADVPAGEVDGKVEEGEVRARTATTEEDHG
ncbi:ABC transporter ATP-binding protein [Aciditerrimonas ferrireducens]|uniref:ABC transporter ATP-binding protein n=1 Tax=Aciditerrimonas ferrireducens TaxID=667306 RepID=A0ABV6C5K1_9ACTN